jgi:hypothetical protein
VFLQILDTGEWPLSVVGLGLTFLIAAISATGIGWYVMRADRLNRLHEVEEVTEEPVSPNHS